jgi:signal transduction histidine kinase
VYAWLRRHPRLVDGVLAAVLALGGIAQALGGIATGFGLHRILQIPFTLALTIPVVFRRAHPVGAFAVAIVAGALQVAFFIRPSPADAAIVVLLYTVAAYTDRSLSLTALVICLAGSAAQLAELAVRHTIRPSLADWLLTASISLAGPCLIAWVLGDSMRYRRAYYVNLEERAARLERDRDAQAKMAAAAERARIARELHDVVAHNVSVMVVQADGAAYAMGTDPGRAMDALAAISATGRQALTEMRVLLGVLRRNDEGQTASSVPGAAAVAPTSPTSSRGSGTGSGADRGSGADANVAHMPDRAGAVTTAELAPMPGLDQLDDLLEQTRAAGLPVSCTVEGEPRPLPDGTALAAYRIIQESLTNTRKHAGPWARARVLLRYTREAVHIVVVDSGQGGVTAGDGAGHGLTGMRERAALYGGSVQAGQQPGGGFQVTAVLPTAPAQSGAA